MERWRPAEPDRGRHRPDRPSQQVHHCHLDHSWAGRELRRREQARSPERFPQLSTFYLVDTRNTHCLTTKQKLKKKKKHNALCCTLVKVSIYNITIPWSYKYHTKFLNYTLTNIPQTIFLPFVRYWLENSAAALLADSHRNPGARWWRNTAAAQRPGNHQYPGKRGTAAAPHSGNHQASSGDGTSRGGRRIAFKPPPDAATAVIEATGHTNAGGRHPDADMEGIGRLFGHRHPSGGLHLHQCK